MDGPKHDWEIVPQKAYGRQRLAQWLTSTSHAASMPWISGLTPARHDASTKRDGLGQHTKARAPKPPSHRSAQRRLTRDGRSGSVIRRQIMSRSRTF